MGPPIRKREGEKWTAPDVLKGWKNRKTKRKRKEKDRKRRLLVFFSEDPGVLDRDADDESWTLIRENALRTVPRQAVERATSKSYHTGLQLNSYFR
ncbi:hypothetical protein TNCV_4976971 [Trichonephila clavipes]|nr:hypothetical protein TNCV_4976971 [Trichonephila clavipes]